MESSGTTHQTLNFYPSPCPVRVYVEDGEAFVEPRDMAHCIVINAVLFETVFADLVVKVAGRDLIPLTVLEEECGRRAMPFMARCRSAARVLLQLARQDSGSDFAALQEELGSLHQEGLVAAAQERAEAAASASHSEKGSFRFSLHIDEPDGRTPTQVEVRAAVGGVERGLAWLMRQVEAVLARAAHPKA